MTLALILIALAIVIFIVNELTDKKQVKPVTNYSFTEGQMERYRGSWNPSPSAFVEKHAQMIQFDGEAEQIRVDNLPSSAFEAYVDFADSEVGKSGLAWLRTYGDNGTVADSLKIRFTVVNAQQVAPVEDYGFVWVSHAP